MSMILSPILVFPKSYVQKKRYLRFKHTPHPLQLAQMYQLMKNHLKIVHIGDLHVVTETADATVNMADITEKKTKDGADTEIGITEREKGTDTMILEGTAKNETIRMSLAKTICSVLDLLHLNRLLNVILLIFNLGRSR